MSARFRVNWFFKFSKWRIIFLLFFASNGHCSLFFLGSNKNPGIPQNRGIHPKLGIPPKPRNPIKTMRSLKPRNPSKLWDPSKTKESIQNHGIPLNPGIPPYGSLQNQKIPLKIPKSIPPTSKHTHSVSSRRERIKCWTHLIKSFGRRTLIPTRNICRIYYTTIYSQFFS